MASRARCWLIPPRMCGMTFNIQAGGVAPFPFTDLSGRKARPALALNAPDTNGDVRFLFLHDAGENNSSQVARPEDVADYADRRCRFPVFCVWTSRSCCMRAWC